ncbi:MAG: hypothetical protein KDA89_02825, partial [Planctomycetaceae bacterium]|nr:hypothetical protein [Planctomycetaceae bacterium]
MTRLSALSLLAVSAATVSVSLNPPVFALAVPQTETQDAPPKTDVSEAPALTESSLTAKEVFEGISRTLEESDSLSCDLTQTVIVGGQRLLATGRYVQAVGNRMRLEYRLYSFRSTKTADAQRLAPDGEPEEAGEAKVTGSLLQVNDGSVFWSLWINGDQKQLTRRNIPKITEAVADVAN